MAVATPRIVLALLLLVLPASAAPESEIDPAAARWLEEVAPLVTPAERAAYLALARPHQRTAFERRFWEVRDPFPETPANELLDLWRERSPAARERWRDLADARALAWILAGEPVTTLPVSCPDLLLPAEIWSYSQVGRIRASVTLIFVAETYGADTRFRAWRPREGVSTLAHAAAAAERVSDLLVRVADSCSRGAEIASRLHVAADWEEVAARAALLPPVRDEWVSGFRTLSGEAPEGATELAATLEISYPGRRGARTLVEGSLRPADPAEHVTTYVLDGEVLRGDEPFERFRYRFQALPERPAPLVFERPLRPGTYRLLLRLHESEGDRYFVAERELTVPQAPEVAGSGDRIEAAAAEDAETPSGATVLLRVPSDRLLVGKVRFEAQTRGDEVAAVAFSLDGRTLLTKRRPPFSAEIDLGRAPRAFRVGAVAIDADGVELARDEALVNGGPHRFALRLVEPRNLPDGTERVLARAVVDVPEGERLERVEFWVDDRLYATLYQPPFAQSLPVPRDARLAWIRAVAYLAEGGAAEDVRLVGAGRPTGRDRRRLRRAARHLPRPPRPACRRRPRRGGDGARARPAAGGPAFRTRAGAAHPRRRADRRLGLDGRATARGRARRARLLRRRPHGTRPRGGDHLRRGAAPRRPLHA
jgi:GWxTD domain-containing protein